MEDKTREEIEQEVRRLKGRVDQMGMSEYLTEEDVQEVVEELATKKVMERVK
jgi:hypothetical protein